MQLGGGLAFPEASEHAARREPYIPGRERTGGSAGALHLPGGRLILAGQFRLGEPNVNCCAFAMPAPSPALRAPSPRWGEGARTTLYAARREPRTPWIAKGG